MEAQSPSVRSDYASWYDRAYPFLSGRGLWLRGGEWNTLPPHAREDRPLRVLIARLSTYADTAESFTHTLLYQALADLPDVFPDLAYLPPPRDGEIMARDGVPWLLGTQTKRGPADFDVIALSNAIVQELVNLPTLLERSGLALPPAERLARSDLPLILLGGANSLHASVLDHADSPVDGIFTGEQLEDIRELMRFCAEGKREGLSKDLLLDRLLAVPGFARPGQDRRARKRNQETLDLRPIAAPRPMLYKIEGLGQEPVAISRGCPAFCSFCAESFDTKPYRENPVDAVVGNALKLKRDMGLEGVDLFSFNFNFYQDLYPLLEELSRRFHAIGLKSQRFDMIARDPVILDYLRAVGKGSLTFGMEGISARLRRYLQKGLDEPDLWKALKAVLRRPLRELKVFLITTGVEEEEDFAEFEAFVQGLIALVRNGTHRPRVVFSATPLVRFPWTPLEFAPAPPPEVYARSARRIGHIARMSGFEYRGAADEAENYVSQVLVRADGPGYWEALKEAVAETGFRYYREMDAGFMDALRSRLAERGIDDARALGGFDLAASRSKPWTRWETGVRREFLHVQYKRARRYVDPGYCLGTAAEEASCLACTACENREEIDILTRVRRSHEADADGFDARRKLARQSAEAVSLAVRLGPECRGLPRKYPALVLASCLMRADQELIPYFRRYREALAPDAKEDCPTCGDDVLRLEWLPEGLARLRDLLADPGFLAEANAFFAGWGELLGEFAGPAQGSAEGNVTAGRPGPNETGPAWDYLFISPFPPDFDRYCKAKGLRHTLRKEGERRIYEFSRDSLKKRILAGAEAEPDESGNWRVRVRNAGKFAPAEFLRDGFRLPAPEEWARIEARAEWLRAETLRTPFPAEADACA